ncbi:hypothetical protein LXL04_036576 [Taraxacum kok-saghyz]
MLLKRLGSCTPGRCWGWASASNKCSSDRRYTKGRAPMHSGVLLDSRARPSLPFANGNFLPRRPPVSSRRGFGLGPSSLHPLRVKMRKGTVLTIAGTMSVILFSNWSFGLWRTHLLEASLMGFSLYLGFLIDRMHHHLQKLINLRKNGGSSKKEVEKLEAEKLQLKEKEEKSKEELNRMQKEISSLSESLKKLKLESKEKDKKIEVAEAHVVSLQKQSADLLLEYDRLLEDNQNLQAQTKNRQFRG